MASPSERPSREELEKLWSDEANWSGAIYFCKKDPRFFVPKRARWMGWTINFGHPCGTAALLGMILIAPAAIAIAAAFN